MIIFLTENAKKHYKRSIQCIPQMFTFMNAFFGFLAILKSLEGSFMIASCCIMLAALMDACDGRVARALRVTSCFGGELDSLADAISFCLAPAVFVYSWYPTPLRMAGICILAFYLCAGLARLARFNTKNAPEASYYFQGLPTTLAAFCIAALPSSIFVHQKIALGIVMILAFLMISTVPFPSFKKGIRFKFTSKLMLMGAVFWSGVLLTKGYPVLFMFMAAFIVGVVLYNGIFWAKRSRKGLRFFVKKLPLKS